MAYLLECETSRAKKRTKMRKRNKVAQLHRTKEHRSALISNMTTSLLYHEEIQTTVGKAKEVRRFVEKVITRAKKNLDENLDAAKKAHNIRLAGRLIKDKEVLAKLFNDIAARYKDINGGYTRVLKIGPRKSDASEMALLELVNKKSLIDLKEERKAIRANIKLTKKDQEKALEDKKDKKNKK